MYCCVQLQCLMKTCFVWRQSVDKRSQTPAHSAGNSLESGGAGKESTEVRELSKKDKIGLKQDVSSSVADSIR